MDRSKDPDEVKDWLFDWQDSKAPGPRLAVGETLTASEFIVPDGITVDPRSGNDDTTATIWLAGGTAGMAYQIVNRVTTSAGRIYEDDIRIRVRNT